MRRRGIGVYGYLVLLLWAAVAPGLVAGARVYWVLATVGALSWLLGTREWRSLGHWRTWLFIGSLVGLGALAQRWSGGAAGGRSGLELGLRMAAQAVAILLAVDALTAHVSIGDLAALMEGLGLAGLGFALGVAFNMLPVLRRTAANVWAALRLRGGLRRPWQAGQRMAVTILTLTLARGQEIVDAAEARAFAPERAPVKRLRWQRADLLLALVLLAWTILLTLR